MRIAYVINSLEGGGAASAVPPVARILRSEGCALRVLALTPRDMRGLQSLEQAEVPTLVRPGGEKDHVSALRWIEAQVRDWQPDLIWTSLTRATLLGQIVGERLGIPVVSWQHNAFLKRANRLLLRLRQRRSVAWIADSRCVAELTHQRLHIEQDRIALWPLFCAEADAPQAKPWQPGQPVRIGSLGRLHYSKGYDVLIQALARLRADGFDPPVPIEIEIGGDGALRAALTAQAVALGIPNLRFVGYVRSSDFLCGLHLYLQPSRREGLCIAAHEAMQAGLPVLASAVGELPHSIRAGRTGSLVPAGDAIALAGMLHKLLENPLSLAAMGRAARDYVLERFGGSAFSAAGRAALQQVNALRHSGPDATVPIAVAKTITRVAETVPR